MTYYDADFEKFAMDRWFDSTSSGYSTWTPGTEYVSAKAAAFAAGQASNKSSTGHHGAPVFSTPAAFGHHGSFVSMMNGGFIEAMIGRSAFGPTANDQMQVLISNEEEAKQYGNSFHLPKLVSVNASVSYR
jgi:hypothetical protein